MKKTVKQRGIFVVFLVCFKDCEFLYRKRQGFTRLTPNWVSVSVFFLIQTGFGIRREYSNTGYSPHHRTRIDFLTAE